MVSIEAKVKKNLQTLEKQEKQVRDLKGLIAGADESDVNVGGITAGKINTARPGIHDNLDNIKKVLNGINKDLNEIKEAIDGRPLIQNAGVSGDSMHIKGGELRNVKDV